ncbi:MAG: YdcF family protein [Candidatus Levybacteria bacterium]|nr:YdcF family protein [Candidatus Levybacteria bacterium]
MKKIILLLGGFVISIYLASLLYIGFNVYTDTAKPSDAIVILGAKSLYKNNVNPCLLARVEKGVSLYKNNMAPKLIMSGGDDGYEKNNQAELMGELAEKLGVPEKNILLEKQSANTYENLLYTKELLDKEKLDSVIIVSDPYHLPRAGLIAKSLGITYSVSPALSSPCWSKYTFFSFDYFRDGFALLQYIATGKIALLTK